MKKLVIIFAFLMLNIAISSSQENQGQITVNIIDTSQCNLDFKPGWNLFSFCSELTETDLLTVFSEINGKYRYIMQWDKTTQAFDIYSPRSLVKPFSDLDDNESYFIYMLEPYSFKPEGIEAGAESRLLVEGWSTPSYPYRFPTLIETMILSIKPDLRYIMKWNTNNQAFDIYSPRALIQPFYDIKMGEGQFIYMIKENILNYVK